MACCNTPESIEKRYGTVSRRSLAHPGSAENPSRAGMGKLIERSRFYDRIDEIMERPGEGCNAHKQWLECMKDVFRDVKYVGNRGVTAEATGRVYVGDDELSGYGPTMAYLGQERFEKWGGLLFLNSKRLSQLGSSTYIGDERLTPQKHLPKT